MRALALGCLLVCAVAGAVEPSPGARQEASTRFGRGVQLFEAQDYAAALAEFEAAHRLVSRYQVLFNVGVTQKKLFRYDEAVRTLARYLDEGGAQIVPDRRVEVERELAEMRALQAEITVRVEGLPARLELDSRVIAETPLLRAILVPPGRHELRATREGCDPAVRTIEVVSGERLAVQLDPPARAEAPTRGTLKLAARPAGAELILDGKSLGRDAWSGEVEPGGHDLRVLLAGHQPARRELMVAVGQLREVTIDLSRVIPLHKRWYVWTTVGIIAAGVVAAGVGGWDATRHKVVFAPIPYPQ